jgi:hypothetical protein
MVFPSAAMRYSDFLSLIIFSSFVTGASLATEVRSWKNANGATGFKACFVKRDATTVTLRGENGKELTKLHPDETRWLDLHQPLVDSSAFFDTLTFADTRETALAKLKASKIVEMTSDETFLGRSGMNGAFRTRQKIGNLNALLYFDWMESGILKELTLQTEDRPEAAYLTNLEPSWKEFVKLLCSIYGEPVQSSGFPHVKSLADGAYMPSHLWKLDGGGAVLLGASKVGANYQVCVRFTKRSQQPIDI